MPGVLGARLGLPSWEVHVSRVTGVISCCLFLAAAASFSLPQAYEVEETPLGRLPPEGEEEGEIALSPDALHIAWVWETCDEKVKTIYLDGEVLGTYDWHLAPSDYEPAIVFSPDSRRVAYTAARGDKMVAVIDGEEGPPYDEIQGLAFSPDSRRVAYFVWDGRWGRMVLDGREGPGHAWVQGGGPSGVATGPAFSRDGEHVAYVAGRVRLGQARVRVFLDEREGPEYDKVWGLVFSPRAGSNVLAYSAEGGEQRHAVIGDDEGPPYDGIGDAGIVFSPDGQHAAHAAKRGDKWFVVADREEGPLYDEIGWQLLFSPDSERLAYTARREESWFVVTDGQEGSSCDGIGEVVFSPDSQRLAYAAHFGERGATRFVVVDGEPGPDYERVEELTFSPDSQRLAYEATRDGKSCVVVDGEEGPAFDHVAGISFSPDSRHIAYCACQGPFGGPGCHVVVDHVWQGSGYATVWPRGAWTGQDHGLAFRDDGSLEYIAVKDFWARELLRVRQVWVEAGGEGGGRP